MRGVDGSCCEPTIKTSTNMWLNIVYIDEYAEWMLAEIRMQYLRHVVIYSVV